MLKKKILKKPRKIKYKAKADRVFSRFIRLRDRFQGDYVKCISCGKILHWKDSHCGHYVCRVNLSLRFNEINCNAQCVHCNIFDEGNSVGYARGLIKKHGEGVLDKIHYCKLQKVRFKDSDYKVMIKHYEQQVEKLEKVQGGETWV